MSISPPPLTVRRWPERRIVVLTTAVLILAALFTAALASNPPPQWYAILYVLPVLLAGLELGQYGGAGAAVVATGLLWAGWAHDGTVGAPDLAVSGVALLAAGTLAGEFSSRMRAGHDRQDRLLDSGLRLAHLESLDQLPSLLSEELQQILDVSSLTVELADAEPVSAGIPVGEEIRLPIQVRDLELGMLTLAAAAGRSFSEEDRAVAARLALQAAVAAENQRLLVAERERAVLRDELDQARRRLASQLHNFGQIMDSQEAERREIARHLHEGSAQAIAGVLLALQVLEGELDQELTRHQLEEVRTVARDTLVDVRELALSLRPPSLDELGLSAALEGMVERASTGGAREVTLDYADRQPGLAPEVQSCAYHLVEDAIRSLEGPLHFRLWCDHERLVVDVQLEEPGLASELLRGLDTARARLELLDGSLEVGTAPGEPAVIRAEVPLLSARQAA